MLTAAEFISQLKLHQCENEQKKIQRYFKSGDGQYGANDFFIGVKMGTVFELAKKSDQMPVAEIEILLESDIHEARAGAVSIMDKASRSKKISSDRLKEFYELYMRRHDRINNWDLVDLGCLHMTGSYLYDKPHDELFRLAVSDNLWERRSSILSTCYFIRKGYTDDTFKLAEILLNDKEDLIHKATGWMLRFAGDKHLPQLIHFLDRYAESMPRTMLRGAIEKFDEGERKYYLKLKRNQ